MAKGRQTVRLPPQQRKPDAPSKKNTRKDAESAANTKEEPLSLTNIRRVALQVFPLLALSALTSPVSQATLKPVYGSIPSSVNHAEAITATVLLGFIWRHFLSGFHSANDTIIPYVALLAVFMPMFEDYLFARSEQLGPVFGAIATGFLSCHAIIIPSAYAAAQALEALDLPEQLGGIAGTAIPAIALDFGFFRPLELVFTRLLRSAALWPALLTPVKLQYFIACSYALLSPSKPYWMFTLAIPPFVHAYLRNPHLDSPRNLAELNRGLAVHNWTVLDRSWSNTGYVSVIESTEMHYRAMRCDHSLLGGEWLLTEERKEKEGWKVNEPIYAVFEMLEAVRLMEVEPEIRDDEAQALVVGLGIGTAPKALMAHGVNTTVVELDPIVHQYAVEYFDLPKQHTAVLQDAVSWVSEQATVNTMKYDYIIHDVFTGGAEPLQLFTDVFLKNLRSLLAIPNGVIALNYAGELGLPLTTRILDTIDTVFEGQCKIFRDAHPPEKAGGSSEDFLNMVVFCRNSPGPVSFRNPTRADFLSSHSREHYLLPRPDFEIAFPRTGSFGEGVQREVLKQGEEGKWRKQQEESAIRHWHIMRRVLPAKVWEMW